MKVSRVGEFGAIDKVAMICGKPGRDVAVGIGDDAAAYRPSPGRLTLVSTDMLVEDVHFDLSCTGPAELGYKSLAVNMSDIAAMGGTPRYYLVSLALGRDTEMGWLEGFYRGMEELARAHRVKAIGGDTCASPGPAVINVTILGDCTPGELIKRSGARPGDEIYVTGCLGGSAGGLDILKAGVGRGLDPAMRGMVTRHLRPEPRVKAGRLLAGLGVVTSMIDVSDGFSSDLAHILAESGAGAEVEEASIPLYEGLSAAFGREKALDLAMNGGEDYELLFTARPGSAGRLTALKRKASTAFTLVGRIVSEEGAFLAAADGGRRPLRPKGYEHFKK